MSPGVAAPPDEGWGALDSELASLLAGVELLPSSEAEFLALDPQGMLLVELGARLAELGYLCPPVRVGLDALRVALSQFQREAGLEAKGWLDAGSWDALHALVALDASTAPARWRDPSGAWWAAYRRALLWRLAALGLPGASPVEGAPSQAQALEAIASFQRAAADRGWLARGAGQEEAAALAFDHRALVDLMEQAQGPASFTADDDGPLARARRLEAERGLSGWADDPALAEEGWEAFGFEEDLEGPEAFGPDAEESTEETLEALTAIAERHGERLRGAMSEVRELGRAGGLWDGIRVAFSWLSRWARRVRQGLADLSHVGRAVLRQAARILHGVGARALAMVRDALRFASSIGGAQHEGERVLVARRPSGDIALFVARGHSPLELEAARVDLHAWVRGHTAACAVVAVLVQVIVSLASGPVGWATLVVRIVLALWRAGLFEPALGGEVGAGAWA